MTPAAADPPVIPDPAAASGGETLADLGEWELIRRLGTFAPPGQFADDAALLLPTAAAVDGRTLVLNTDVLVEGIHFSDATTEPLDVGWRATAANLSDLAAMGATEVIGISVGLVAPSSTAWSWVEKVYEGISAVLRDHGGLLLGGDCSSGAQRLLAITALGRLATDAGPIRRSDGRPGDQLLCTGPHGLSRLGLALLQAEPLWQPDSTPTAAQQGDAAGQEPAGTMGAEAGEAARRPSKGWNDDGREQPPRDPQAMRPAAGGQALRPISLDRSGASGVTAATTGADPSRRIQLPEALIQRAITTHRRPIPRFDAVQALIASRPSGMPWRLGGCDSSDGLMAAVAAIAQASGCAARLDRTQLPLETAMAVLPQAETWCLSGGEDFELVLALPRIWAEALLAALPGSRWIGELLTGPAGDLGWSDGRAWPGNRPASSGYQHFA